jgi:peptidyl-prolyl cis-trans isomerase A (cyclophilin A)
MAAPTGIRLSQLAINESEKPGGFVAVLATVDADAGETFTYRLVDGEGAEHNSWFEIQGNLLVNTRVVDREQHSSLKLRLRSTDRGGQSVERVFSLAVNNLQDPLPLAAPAAIRLSPSGSISVALNEWFVDPFSSGRIARFHLDPALAAAIQKGLGETFPELRERSWLDVVLFDRVEQGAPRTVANLEQYVANGRYRDTFFHRLVPNFVLQGGGFVWPGNEIATSSTLAAVPALKAVPNEFSELRSNIRGTLAMAKLGTDPNSATSQWFFSLADNSANLDDQNGGFTVFGRLRDSSDLLLLDVLGAVDTINADNGGVFSSLPLYRLGDTAKLAPTDVLRLSEVELLDEPPLRFELSLPEASPVKASVDGTGQLSLEWAGRALGTREIVTGISVTATNLLGESIQHSLDLITGWTADLDRNGLLDPLTDGLAIAAVAVGQQLTSLAPQLETNLTFGLQNGYLDLDQDGRVDRLDAQLLLRHSFGTFPGVSLTAGLLTVDRESSLGAASVQERLGWLQPPLP